MKTTSSTGFFSLGYKFFAGVGGIVENVKGTRGNIRARKMWSCRERAGTTTGIPSAFCSRPRSPDPIPDLGLCSHRLWSRLAVSCSRRAATRVFDSSRPAVHPVAAIPYRSSRTISPVPQITLVADVSTPFTTDGLYGLHNGWKIFIYIFLYCLAYVGC